MSIESSLSQSAVVDITNSALWKSGEFLRNLGWGKKFLESLHDAWITPNNFVTFRLALMVSGAVTYLIQKDVGAVAMTVSCVLDSVDGKLARNFRKSSKEGEIYDPASDKVSESLLSFLSFLNLTLSEAAVQTPAMIARLYYHYQSQFNETRGNVQEQCKIIKKLILHWDEGIEYIDWITDWAASTSGKVKTIFQLTSGLWIIWVHTHIAQEVLSLLLKLWIPTTLEAVTQFLTWAFIWAWVASLPFAFQSAQSKKKP